MQIGFVVAEMSLSSHRLPIDIQILNGGTCNSDTLGQLLLLRIMLLKVNICNTLRY